MADQRKVVEPFFTLQIVINLFMHSIHLFEVEIEFFTNHITLKKKKSKVN